MWSAADIQAWESEIKPLSLHNTPTLKSAAAYFHQQMLKADIKCPLGGKVGLMPGHFFPLVCCAVPGNQTKGFVTAAKSLAHAFELIEQGVVDVAQVAGCNHQRVNELPLFLDVVENPHVIARKDSKKRVYLKRYESAAKKPRVKVAVAYLVEELLRPASFYTTDLDVTWLNQNAHDVLWKKNEG